MGAVWSAAEGSSFASFNVLESPVKTHIYGTAAEAYLNCEMTGRSGHPYCSKN